MTNMPARRLSVSSDTATVVIVVDRASVFHGVLHVAGYAFCATQFVLGVTVTLANGLVLPLPRNDLPTPVLAKQFGSYAAACGFDESFVLGDDAGAVIGAQISAQLSDGQTHVQPLAGPDPTDTVSSVIDRFFAMLQQRPVGRLLEIGARDRTGAVYIDKLPPGWRYTGFDIAPGPNVDIVGDAHAASTFLPHRSFDGVMSFAVFEHLLMPWKAVIEMNRVMCDGGIGLIVAPQTWPLHEEPCDYFRFSAHAWKGLLNSETGFEILQAEHGHRAYIVPRMLSPATAFGEVHTCALMSAVLFRKISETELDWPVKLTQIAADDYPA